MRAIDIIARKRDGQALSADEIRRFVQGFTRGEIPDYQAAAWLMAVCIRGMDAEETTALTLAMVASGDQLDYSGLIDYAVDKHSSGGVGDKTSLVVLPLVASCGVPVAKMSGRGLGYSGGTLDKLESIPGFNVNLTEDQFRQQVSAIGLVLGGQTHQLAPADGKLYALRDVTASVPSIPLIASSIMSKKIAAGANGIVLDVKVGDGAFMKGLGDARLLADLMVQIGQQAGRDVVALISDMNQPLGRAVGHALEVVEAIDTLRGGGPADFAEHCLTLAGYMLELAGRGLRWTTTEETRALLQAQIASGAAFDRFRQMVIAQGGDPRVIDDPSRLPQAALIEPLTADRDGYVSSVAAETVARAAFDLGAGREKKGDPIAFEVGIVVHVNVGDQVRAGDRLAMLHASDSTRLESARALLSSAFRIAPSRVEPLPLFYDVIRSSPQR
jgi:pyrimidine-nucleoside phosphorylase